MNLQEALRILGSGRVRKGEAAESACRSDRMNAIMDAIQALARGENVVSGINLRKRVSEGSFILSGMPGNSGRGGGGDFPFELTLVTREDDPALYAVEITDGKVNNEWPDVGTDTMGSPDGNGALRLNIASIDDSNVFLRVMFNAKTNTNVRLDIYERPNATFPTNKITYLAPDAEPVTGACNSVDNPNDPPPAGFGAINILLGFTYLKPPPVGSPPGTLSTPTAFNLVRDHIALQLVWGSKNGLPALLPAMAYTDWVKIPLAAP